MMANHPKIGKVTNDTIVRPKEDLFGNALRDDTPLERTRGIGDGQFVVLPPFENDWKKVEAEIAKLKPAPKATRRTSKGEDE
ncbi:MAG: hypothetical protein ACYS7Y_35345 [Planctomycetota bacterium]|jgi:hypothetical protein